MKEYTKGCEFLGVENQFKKAMINEAPKNTELEIFMRKFKKDTISLLKMKQKKIL